MTGRGMTQVYARECESCHRTILSGQGTRKRDFDFFGDSHVHNYHTACWIKLKEDFEEEKT
jgi:hypothetical protein